MKARPNLSGNQLVQDYLHRVAAAARTLPKGARIAFVGRTKAQIERQVGAVEIADPGQVMEALAALGEPEELVRAERLRIDSKWLKNRARDDRGRAATAPAPSSPRVYRHLKTRWRPAAPHLRPQPQADPTDPAAPIEPAPIEAAPLEPTAISPPARVSPPTTVSAPNGTIPPAPDPSAPMPWPGDLEAIMSPGTSTAGGGPGQEDKQTPLDGAWQLARGHLLESVAVVLIGLGGAILPFPFWLAGVVVAVFSRLWDGRDKVAAIGGPVLVVLVGSVVSALFMGGKHNVIVIYTHALHVDTGLWIRLGCPLTAVYLAWRVSKGRRVKVPPWKR